MKRKHAFILAILITILVASNFYFFQKQSSRESVYVTRVIDGDTFQFGEESARLVNINTPEKSEKGYEEAKNFLKSIEKKEVEIEELGRDKYGRVLVKVYSPDYLNLKIVEKGLATKFLVQESELKEFAEAEKNAIAQHKGIWKESDFSNCFQLRINAQDEFVTIPNICQNSNLKDFVIRDESRKRYKFQSVSNPEITLHSAHGKNNETDIFWGVEGGVWNNDRDTAYLLDPQNRIAAYYSYGY